MNKRLLRGLAAGLISLFVIAGCASTAEPEPMPEPEPMETKPAPPPKVVAPPKPVTSPDGVPLDDDGQPIATVFYFDFDKSELKPRARTMLAGHAAYLSKNANVRVTIEGHADERGTREYNLALGERRASAVRSFLQSLGVRSSQVSVVSYGEERPIDPGHSESAWAKNRRAEIDY
ncbi:MAG TPA: peptidoglycan-associated lipoprotein Pal [Pseudomonadales bacterium]|nr:peptidoglycan-associated lipoprotein Pal [Pseudomonadales bacterium]